MHDITLICTVHAEAGACSLNELYRILDAIDPEIIFEELPPSSFGAFYTERSRKNLETDTIIKYIESHPIEHIPVDYDEVPPSLLEDSRRMHLRVEAISPEYRRVLDWHSTYVRQYGFPYLNSIYCSNLNNDLDKAIEQTLPKINDNDLLRILNLWNGHNEKREDKMINNIYGYSERHNYHQGLFFIGAGHRESIIKKIQKKALTASVKVNWNHDYFKSMIGNA